MRAFPRKSILAATTVCLALLALPSTGHAQPCPRPVVESVIVVRHDVFSAAEVDSAIPRLVNKLHLKTRRKVVERELLFVEGDLLDPERLAQTERNLRERPFLSDVRVDVVDADGSPLASAAQLVAPGARPCDLLRGRSAVTVRVITRDAWSTALEMTFRQAGDRTIWELGIEESNFLGRGKSLGFAHRDDIDRSSRRFAYRDLQLGGSHHRLIAEFADQSDGSRGLLEVGRPFLSLDDRWSWRLRAESFDQRQPLYRRGEEVDRLRHVRQHQSLRVSRLLHRRGNRALRAQVAVRRLGDDVEGARRDFRVLEAGIRAVEHRYVQLRYVNHARPVDLNLGAESFLRFGVALPGLGGGRETPAFLTAGHRRGFRLGEQRFLLGEASWDGRFQDGLVTDAMLRVGATFLDRSRARRASLARVRIRAGTRLDPERQVTLGAQNGLRGYPVHQWVGDRSLLLGLEHRWFFADDVLGVASLGVAAFLDSGYAWPQGTALDLGDLRSNVGLSLLIGRRRLATTEAGMRIDLAYALDPLSDRSPWLLSFGRLIDLD